MSIPLYIVCKLIQPIGCHTNKIISHQNHSEHLLELEYMAMPSVLAT